MAYVIAFVVLCLCAFIAWKLRKKPVVTPPVTSAAPTFVVTSASPVLPVTYPAVDPNVTTARLGTVTEALMGGKPVSNGPTLTGYDARSAYRKDFNLDGPGTFWFPAGVSYYTVKASGGDILHVIVGPAEEGHGAGSISVSNQSQPIINGYASMDFQAQSDNPALTVTCDKPGLIQRS